MIEIQLAGIFSIVVDGRRLPDTELGSRKGRLLLKLLVLNRGHVVSTDRIVDALWGGATPAHLDENIAALVSRLRNVVGKAHIEGGRGGYVFRPSEACAIDVDTASGRVEAARYHHAHGNPVVAGDEAGAALVILDRGDLLEEDQYADWAAPARLAKRRLHRAAREVAWSVATGRGDFALARQLAESAIEADALDEEAYRVRMFALYQAGEAARALQVYEELRAVTADELGADPSPESQALHRAILRGEIEPLHRRPAVASEVGTAHGREAELGVLRAAWEQAVQAGPGLVILVGDAGAGKTYLAAALAADLSRDGALVLSAQCFEIERSLFLEPALDALRPVIGSAEGQAALADLPPGARADLVPLLPDVAPLIGEESEVVRFSPEEERARAFKAVVAFLSALARRRPVLLAIDDLHNAGPSTIELIHAVIRRGRGARILVLGAVRSTGLAIAEDLLRAGDRIDVGPLSTSAVARLCRADGLDEIPENLMAITGGNALHVVESLRAMRHAAAPDMPASLRAAIRERAESAGPELTEFLRAGSVVGTSFDLDTVDHVLAATTPGRSARLGEHALRMKLLVESGIQYRFAHELIRDAIYDAIPGPTRAAWHRRVAALEATRGGRPHIIGDHAARSGDHQLAVASFLQAATLAGRTFSNVEAEEMLTRALDAATSLDDDARRAQILLQRSAVRVTRDAYDLAEADLDVAVGLARKVGDFALETRTIEQRGWSLYLRRDLSGAGARVDEIATRPDHGVGADLLAARVHHARGQLSLARASAQTALDEARRTGNRADQARALSYLGSMDSHVDAYAAAIDRTAQAEILGRGAAVFHPTLNGLFFRGLALGNSGALEKALTAFTELQVQGRAGDTNHYEARSLNGQAWMWLELGDPSHAAELADQALAAATGPLFDEPRANALFQLARVGFVRGDLADAEAILEEGAALGIDAAFGWRYELRALDLQACIVRARGESADEIAEKLLLLAAKGGAPKYTALALSHLGRRSEAEAAASGLNSDLLTARVAAPLPARAAAERIAATLQPARRQTFLQTILPDEN